MLLLAISGSILTAVCALSSLALARRSFSPAALEAVLAAPLGVERRPAAVAADPGEMTLDWDEIEAFLRREALRRKYS